MVAISSLEYVMHIAAAAFHQRFFFSFFFIVWFPQALIHCLCDVCPPAHYVHNILSMAQHSNFALWHCGCLGYCQQLKLDPGSFWRTVFMFFFIFAIIKQPLKPSAQYRVSRLHHQNISDLSRHRLHINLWRCAVVSCTKILAADPLRFPRCEVGCP